MGSCCDTTGRKDEALGKQLEEQGLVPENKKKDKKEDDKKSDKKDKDDDKKIEEEVADKKSDKEKSDEEKTKDIKEDIGVGNLGPPPEESGDSDTSDNMTDEEKRFIIKPKNKFFNSQKQLIKFLKGQILKIDDFTLIEC